VIDADEAVLTVGAFNTIKKMIIDLEFRPGEILMVQSLAQQHQYFRVMLLQRNF